jgi:predicted amidohydrolase YtcJ
MREMSSVKSDLMFHEGRIAGHPQSDSIAVGGGRIMACGRYDDLKPLVGPGTRMVRLEGRTVAPGLIDSHLHFLEAASVAAGVMVSRARDINELLAELRQAAARCAPGNWLKAFGCDEALLKEHRGPTRQELDAVVPKNPLRLRHQTLHASWINSRAINLLGLEKPDFAPPPGARLFRDESNRLTGLVTGIEEWLTTRLPPVTTADLEARAKNLSRELAAAGVTGFTDATARNSPKHVEMFGQLVAWGALAQHATVMLGEDHIESWPDTCHKGREAGVPVLAIKFRGARESNDPELNYRVQSAIQAGAGCAFHATEIEEVEAALCALEAARDSLGPEALARVTCRIEHGGVIAPHQISRISSLRAWVVTNPGFIFYRGEKYLSEPGLIPYTYRCRSLDRAAIRMAAGTDAPVTPARPLVGIAAAAMRIDRYGRALAPQERIELPEAYRLFSSAGAELAVRNAGILEPGRAADLIVLPRDPLTMAPAELAEAAVELTVIAGQVVYERGRPATFTGIPDTI